MAQQRRENEGGGTTLTNDEINYMVYRYLQESGFSHSAFVLAHESQVYRAPLDPNLVSANSLVAMIQKGMAYTELEANVQDGEVDDFTMLDPKDLITNNLDELRELVRERKTEQSERRQQIVAKVDQTRDRAAARKRARGAGTGNKAVAGAAAGAAAQEQHAQPHDGAAEGAGTGAPAGPADIPEATTLLGHGDQVYSCRFSPTELLLASCSADTSARIFDLRNGGQTSVVLDHEASMVVDEEHHKQGITTLDWAPTGQYLATGSIEGAVRIWSKAGKVKHVLKGHTESVPVLKWSPEGSLLLTGSEDNSTMVWDAKSGNAKQQFKCHTAPITAVAWANKHTFASGSKDGTLKVCKVGQEQPTKSLHGHSGDINALAWDSTGSLLASASDDHTTRVWSLQSDSPVLVLSGHTREVGALDWRPASGGSTASVLATCSYDATARLWDCGSGRCLHTLQKHSEVVYAVAFSPNGRHVATGGFDAMVYVWDVDSGQLLRSFKGDGTIYSISWDSSGQQLAACGSSKAVHVLDTRLLS